MSKCFSKTLSTRNDDKSGSFYKNKKLQLRSNREVTPFL